METDSPCFILQQSGVWKMTIKVLGIAPYPGVKDLLLQLSKRDPDLSINVEIADLQEALPIVRNAERQGYDVIVSRGGTASLIRRHVSLPVVDIPVSGYDILRAMTLIKDSNSKIAIVGFPNVCQGAATVSSLLDFEIPIYAIERETEVRSALKKAFRHGAQIVLGDVVTVRTAKEMGYNGILITSGPESVQEALAEVKRVHAIYRKAQENARLYKAILDAVPRGIVAAGPDGRIRYLNRCAMDILGCQDVPERAANLADLSPELAGLLAEAARSESFASYAESSAGLPDGPEGLEPSAPWGQETGMSQSGSDAGRSVGQPGPIRLGGRLYSVQLAVHDDKAEPDWLIYLEPVKGQAEAGPSRPMSPVRQLAGTVTFSQIIGSSRAIRQAIARAKSFAQTDKHIWITGEPGSGRSLFAQAVHSASSRADQSFYMVSCLGVPPAELEAALFGNREQTGLLETNTGGTLYLAEIDRLPLDLQEKLVTVLQKGVAVRIIASSTVPWANLAESGEFCRELALLLGELYLSIPPLRERPDDIPELARVMIASHNSQFGKQIVGIRQQVLKRLMEYNWPGNVQEFQQVLEEMLILTKGHYVGETAADAVWERYENMRPPQNNRAFAIDLSGTWEQIEQRILLRVLQEEGMNQSRAARRLGINRTTLWRKLHDVLQNKTNDAL